MGDTSGKIGKKSSKPVMDVSKPGKTAPSASSRPIIIGHQSVQDATVNEQPTAPEVKEEKVSRSGPKVVMPISDDLKPDAIESAAEEAGSEGEVPVPDGGDTAEPPEVTDDSQEEVTEVQPTEDVKETKASTTTNSETAAVDAVAEQADAKKKELQASDEEKKRQKEFEKLIASRKYHVPIGERTRRKRRSRGLVVLLLALLLIAGGYAAADKFTDLPLPYEFFKAASQAESTESAIVKQEPGVQPEATASTVPEGFVEYKNEEIGISFMYPKEWGEVTVKETLGDGRTTSGTDVRLSFSSSSRSGVTLYSRDYKILQGGRGGAYWDAPTAFRDAQVEDAAWDIDRGYAQKIFINEENLKISASCSDFTASITLNAYPKLSTHETFDTGNFYFLIRDAKSDGSGIDLDGCDEISTLVKEYQDDFLQFARSIQVL